MGFVIVHGLGGSGPDHWQSWLAGRLRERGLEVSFPTLPDPDRPQLERWLETLEAELERLGPSGTTVICHSLGCLLWLHRAARRSAPPLERVLLVAPTQPDVDEPESAGFRPTPLEPDRVREAASSTLLVCSTDDPWGPPEVARRISSELDVPIAWLEKAGHVNAASGYGPWPALEAWALGERGGLG